MLNRFANCKTFVELQKVLGDSIDFNTLSAEEVETLVTVFRNNASTEEVTNLDLPLTEAGYKYICTSVQNVVINIATQEMGLKGGFNMSKVVDGVKGFYADAVEAVKNAKREVAGAGKSNIETLSKSCDNEISILSTVLSKTIKAIAVGTADPELGIELANIFARLMSTNSISATLEAGKTADEAVLAWYERLSLIDPDHVTFKEAWAFTEEIGLDKNGKPVKQFRGVFTILLGGINWIACWLVEKCHAGLESIGEIGKAVGFAIATVFGVAKALLKLVIKVATYVVVNGITIIISICSAIFNGIKKLGSKIFTKKEEEELDDFEDELDTLIGNDEE